MVTIDARGLTCPMPLMLVKKALNKDSSQQLEIHIDNEMAKSNLERFLSDQTIDFITQQEEEQWIISTHITDAPTDKTAVKSSLPNKKAVQEDSSHTKTTICLNSDQMGEGPKELGKILIQAFINTIPELDQLPESIIFYNNGVHLAVDNSPVKESLIALVEKGVKLYICGTCIEYFSIKDKINIGTISNMYEILELLSKSSKVIYP